MSWSSIFSDMRRNSLVPLMLLVQVALACAILCNVLYLVQQKIEPMLAPSGLDAGHLIIAQHIQSSGRAWSADEVQAATRALRQVPGVRAVSAGFSLPMSDGMVDDALQGSTPVKKGVNGYMGKGLIRTLGLKLVAGRDFLPGEYRPFGLGGSNPSGKRAVTPIIISQSLAESLYGGHAVGKLARDPEYTKPFRYRVVGVVRHLLRTQLNRATDGRADDTILLPFRMGSSVMLDYAIRVAPGTPHGVLKDIRKVIQARFGPLMGSGSHAEVEYYGTLRTRAFKSRRAALWLFAGIALTVLTVTLIGIMGLTGFWVQRRTRQIGIRRALGARRIDILRQFLTENAVIVAAGVMLGMLLAYVGNHLLMRYYELGALPLSFLPVGALMMLLLGQLAALVPARRAAQVPPVVATRSV